MMKINSPRSSKKLLIVVTVCLFAIAGYMAYAYQTKIWPFISVVSDTDSKIDYSPPTDEQKQAGDEVKKQTVDDTTGDKGTPPDSSSLPLQTYLTTASISEGTLYIRNEIDGLFQEGACTLKLTKDSVTVTKTSGIQALPKSSTCRGFNIATSELSNGVWDISLTININGRSGTASGKVTV